MHVLISLFISIPMAIWVYQVTKGRERYPMAWAIFTVLAWPIPAMIIGLRHRRWVLGPLGIVGVYLLSVYIVFVYSILMATYEWEVYRMLLGAIAGAISLAVLLSISFVIIARRCRGRLYGFIHGFVGLMLLMKFTLPIAQRCLWQTMGTANYTFISIVMAAVGIGTMLASVMVLWLGFILSSRESRKPFLMAFVSYSAAAIICWLVSALVLPAGVSLLVRQMDPEVAILIATIPSTLLSIVPVAILLLRVITVKVVGAGGINEPIPVARVTMPEEGK